MALKDIFTMIKADRYTADGCEEIKKAQEAIAEDGGLPDGTMRHRKDGDYIKQAGKWVPAKKGNGGAKKNGPLSPAKRKAERIAKMQKETGKAAPYGRTLKGTPKTPDDNPLTERTQKRAEESKPAEAKTYKNEEGRRDFRAALEENPTDAYDFEKTVQKSIPMSQGDKEELQHLKSFMREEHTDYKQALISRATSLVDGHKVDGDWYPEKEKSIMKIAKAVGYDKDLHKFIEEEFRGYDLGYSEDAAPRVLTGDCKVRLAKDARPTNGIYHWKSGDYRKEGDKYVKIGPGRGGAGKSPATQKTSPAGSKPATTSWNDAKYGLVNKAGVPLDITSVTFSMTPAWARSHGFSPDDVDGHEAQRKTASKIIRNQDWSNPEEAVKKINEMDFGYNNWKVTEKQADKVKIESKDRLGNVHILTVKRPEATPPASTESKPAEAPKFKSRNTIMLEKKGFKEVEKGGAYPKLHRFEYKSKSGKTYNIYRDIGSDGFFYHVQTPGGFTKKMSDVGEIKKYLDSDGGNWGHAPGPRGLVSRPYTEKDLVKSNNDAAPRQLTGDCKVRIKKS